MVIHDPVLLNQWHPVLLSSELNELPKAVEILGEKVVVYRTTEGVHAFQDLCIHRGVPLSLGKVVNQEIICPYHGWSYNQTGQCTFIPSLAKDKSIPIKAQIKTYTCTEDFDFIWVCLGEPEQDHPIIDWEELSNPEFITIQMGPYELKAIAPRVVENFLDVSHLMFVHEGLLGDQNFPEISDYKVHQLNDYLLSDEIKIYQPDSDGRGHEVQAKYTYKVFNPLCVSFVKNIDESDDLFKLYLIVLPVNEQVSKAFMIMERNYDLEVPEQIFIDFQNRLIEQDRIIVENQKPELLPLDLQAELHLNSDRMSLAYRRMLKEKGMTFGTA